VLMAHALGRAMQDAGSESYFWQTIDKVNGMQEHNPEHRLAMKRRCSIIGAKLGREMVTRLARRAAVLNGGKK